MNSNSWFKRKPYPHFDMPLRKSDAIKLVSDPKKVVSHSFLPFLSFELKDRRFGKAPKVRKINYASHKDGYIYSYYAQHLDSAYETELAKSNLSSSILAYRRNRGSNIEFANEAFDRIVEKADCTAIGFDIEKIFDNLDHKHLKKSWATLLKKESKLPDDWYSIFNSITKFSSIDRDNCFKVLKYNKAKIKTITRICSITEFRNLRHSRKFLISKNKRGRGIPQGTAISAALANLYLLEFDKIILQYVNTINGVYRRYSDDILIIVEPEYASATEYFVDITLRQFKLSLNKSKTTSSTFQKTKTGNIELCRNSKPFQYLGFVFDGEKRLIRSQTISRYWRKVVRSINRAKSKASRAARLGRNQTIFKRQIYERYTHIGKRNFLTYARRSAKVMTKTGLWTKSAAWKQIKGHAEKIEKLLN